MAYEGYAFDIRFERGRKSGLISINNDHLVFKSDSDELWLAIDENLEITSSGSGGRVIYFNRLSNPDVSFCTSNKAILKEQALKGLPSITALKRRKSKVRSITAAVLITIIACIAGLAYSLFANSSPIIKFAADKVPFEWEQKLGDAISQSVLANTKFINDKNLVSQLETIADPLVNVIRSEKPQYKFDFFIADDPQVNAFALPGGKVVVYSGLIEKADSPEEIAGVLAHEIAHVTCRHHIRSIMKGVGLTMVVSFILGDFSKLGDLGTSLAMFSNSRAFEYEADRTGLKYLNQADIDPQGMVSFFDKIIEKHNDETEYYQSINLFSTHPPTEERIKELNKLITNEHHNNQYKDINIDFQQFKQAVTAASK